RHACALLETGELRCWGNNREGQVGSGMAGTNQLRPTPVLTSSGGPPLSGVVDVAAGYAHTCALLASGELRCWGHNAFWQL
ncbi:MAG: RTX toxin, partial [Sandaracinaceae bacterium]|nr:RTX toxin [Sandaracinaceae bacterium]